MNEIVEHALLDEQLKRCGANWEAAQTHGLLTGRLAVAGTSAAQEWLQQVFEGVDLNRADASVCRATLDSLYQTTYWQLSERLSEFSPLLPNDDEAIQPRIMALAHWAEGFLHGLVSTQHGDALKARLGEPPLSDIIKDVLQITRAGVDYDEDDEDNESAYAEIVEYLRVVAQLSYEELAEFREPVVEKAKQDG